MQEPLKCVFVISSELNPGQAMNCSALLAAALGAERPDLIGAAPKDASGITHSGLCSVPISVLRAGPGALREIRQAAQQSPGLTSFDVTTISQRARKYAEVLEWTAQAKFEELEFVGVGLLGPKSAVVAHTKNLELYK